jgi:methyl-accepting chemotaxis protein
MMSLTKRSEQAARHQGIKDRSKENDEIMRRLLEQVREDPQLLRRLEEFEAIRSAFRETRETQVMPLIYARKIDEAKGLFTGIQAERSNKMASISDALVDEAKERARTEVVNMLISIAGEILAATTQVASGAVETATAVSQTTTTVEEVKRTAEVSSQKAKYVSESAKKTVQVSRRMGGKLSRTPSRE